MRRMKTTTLKYTIGALALLSLGCSGSTTGETRCLALPVCAETETQVETCEPGLNKCHEVSKCGQTIGCYTKEESCGAVPTSDEDDQEVASQDECPLDTACVPVEACGIKIWCWGAPDCAKENPCAEGETLVFSQSDCIADGECAEATVCYDTVWCTAEPDCLEIPECNEGDKTVAEGEECPSDAASCYEVSACSQTVNCAVEPECGGLPMCDEGDQPVDGPGECLQDDAKCYEVTGCGETIWCTGVDPAPTHVLLGGGSSFGFCFGACKRELTFAGSGVTLVISSPQDEAPLATITGTLTEAGQAAAASIAVELSGYTLQTTYGCPDCADGGASHVLLLKDGKESKHTYEFSNPPVELEAVDSFINTLILAVEGCKSTDHFVPAEDCKAYEG